MAGRASCRSTMVMRRQPRPRFADARPGDLLVLVAVPKTAGTASAALACSTTRWPPPSARCATPATIPRDRDGELGRRRGRAGHESSEIKLSRTPARAERTSQYRPARKPDAERCRERRCCGERGAMPRARSDAANEERCRERGAMQRCRERGAMPRATMLRRARSDAASDDAAASEAGDRATNSSELVASGRGPDAGSCGSCV